MCFSSEKYESCNELANMNVAWISKCECLLLFIPDELQWFLGKVIGYFHGYSSIVNTAIKRFNNPRDGCCK